MPYNIACLDRLFKQRTLLAECLLKIFVDQPRTRRPDEASTVLAHYLGGLDCAGNVVFKVTFDHLAGVIGKSYVKVSFENQVNFLYLLRHNQLFSWTAVVVSRKKGAQISKRPYSTNSAG